MESSENLQQLGPAQLYQFEKMVPEGAPWEAMSNGIWQLFIPVPAMLTRGQVVGYMEMPPKVPYGFEVMPCVRLYNGISVRLTYCCDEANSRFVILAKGAQGGVILNPNKSAYRFRFMVTAAG